MPLALRVLIGCGLAVALFFSIDPSSSFNHLLNADMGWVMFALAVSVAGVLVSGLKWRTILLARRVDVPLRDSIGFYWIGMFFSNFLPTSIGGDAVRVTLAREHGSTHELAASILVERLTGLVVLFGILAVGLAATALFGGEFPVPPSVWLLLLITAGCMGLAMLLPRTMRRVCRLFRRRLPKPMGPLVIFGERLLHAFSAYRLQRPALVRAMLLSLPFYLTILAAHAGVLAAVGVEIRVLDIAVAAPLVSLVSVLPIVPNGAGLAEGAFVVLYAATGVPVEAAFAAAILRRLIDLGNSAIGGGLWALRRRPILRPA